MQRIRLLTDQGRHSAGEVIEVENNEAHRLIDSGFGVLASMAGMKDRMVGEKSKESVIKRKNGNAGNLPDRSTGRS